jgi:capsular exopolysaccharide synthesis family protein
LEQTARETSRSSERSDPGLIESVWRYRWLVAAITVLTAAAAYGVSFLQSPTYEAEARLLLTDPAAGGLFEEIAGAGGERFLANQTEVANSPDVHARAAELLGGDYTEEEVGGKVTVRPSEDVDLLTVNAEGGTPEEAAGIANAVGEAYTELRGEDIAQRAERSISQLEESMAQLRERIDAADAELAGGAEAPLVEAERDAAATQLATFESRAEEIAVDAALFGSGVDRFTEARPPATPTQPQPRRNAAVGLVLGALAGAALAWYRAERVNTAEERRDPAPILQAPLLGQVPEYKSVGVVGLDPARSAPDSVAAESYQFLVSSLEYALAKIGGRSVVITSAGRASGKTLTAFNLAIAAARDGRHVVLCDGDERTRGLTSLTRTVPTPGLTDLADEDVPLEGAIAMIDVPASAGLPFVAAGTRPPDPAGFFRTAGFRLAMRRVKEHGDLLIVDSPPLLAVSDTSSIASQVDGIVVVVPQGTPLRTLQEARERLDFIGTPVLGYVFNRSHPRGAARYGYGIDPRHGFGKEMRPAGSRPMVSSSSNGSNHHHGSGSSDAGTSNHITKKR